MSAEIITMPLSADKAWERYAALVRECQDDNTLLADRQYLERLAIAEIAFKKAFAKECGKGVGG